MRDWHLTAESPLSMRFAADVRLRQTDYADDQSWEVVFGKPEEPALAFQTRYGGRAGLARLVPMFVFEGKPIYESHLFHAKPVLTAFAPNYAKITASPTNQLDLTSELWVMDSHAVGGRFSLTNKDDQPLAVRVEMFAQIVREREMINMNLLGLDDGSEVLHLGVVGNLNPILLFEGAASLPTEGGAHISPKLSSPVTIQPGQTITLRWVHAGWPSLNNSLQAAYKWMNQVNWDEAIKQIDALSAATPSIETGNADWDAAFAFSTQVLLRSFVGPTQYLPNPSYVTARIPSRGFSPHGDGRDHGWQWNGQTALVGILALPSIASIAPDLARGAVKNAVATAKPDGWIDYKPGLGGQRANALSLPLWATTAWRIYEIVEDKRFLEDIFGLLVKFFERWFQTDVNHDDDAIPEWTTAAQSGYGDNPIFARYRRWAQNADISRAEAPDLAAYLISEANSLLNMAEVLGQSAASVKERLDKLKQQLDMLWSNEANCYVYHDRDTHLTLQGQVLFKGKGDEPFDTKTTLNPPNRLILRIIGGKDHTPKASVTIEGVDAQGKATAETVSHVAFAWHYGMGSAVSQQAYSQVNYVKFEGISRVYSIELDTVDLTRHNQTLLMPLWTGATNQEQIQRLIQIATDPERYWRTYGMSICPANDPAFAPNNENGSGGVWLLWNTLTIEGLLAHDATEQAMVLFTKMLDAQIKTLRQDHAFREAYNSETGEGIGDLDELWGIVPLHLVMRLIGLRVVNHRRVWAGGLFLFPQPVTITQHGIEITRSAKGTYIKFPSGHVAEVGAEWQLIEDPMPESAPQVALEPVAVPVADQAVELDETEASGLPETASMIPVESKKDDTLEVPISQIDFDRPPDDNPDSPTVFKIPVSGSEE